MIPWTSGPTVPPHTPAHGPRGPQRVCRASASLLASQAVLLGSTSELRHLATGTVQPPYAWPFPKRDHTFPRPGHCHHASSQASGDRKAGSWSRAQSSQVRVPGEARQGGCRAVSASGALRRGEGWALGAPSAGTTHVCGLCHPEVRGALERAWGQRSLDSASGFAAPAPRCAFGGSEAAGPRTA